MTIDLNNLQKLCEEATPPVGEFYANPLCESKFHSALNPQTALALIAVVRASQKVCATNYVQLGLLNELDEALQPFMKEG